MQRNHLATGLLGGVLLFVLILPRSALAQITFEKAYGGSGRDVGRGVQRTSDGGYIIAGYTESFGAGAFDVYLVKTDSVGDTLWTRTYGGSADDYSYSVQQTLDGGYILVGATYSFGAGGRDVFLIKTDASGNSVWTRAFGGNLSDGGWSVQQTLDGGYIAVGETESFGASGVPNVYLIKTNSMGDSLWMRTYADAQYTIGKSVVQTAGGDYVVAGSAGNLLDVYLIKASSSGDSVWARRYGDYREDASSVQQTFDGGYIIAGRTRPFPSSPNDIYLVKTNSAGDSLWAQVYGGAEEEAAKCVWQTFDGGYVITGLTSSIGAGSFDLYLLKTSSIGDTIWTRTLGGVNSDAGYSIKQTPDTGYAITGDTRSWGAGSADMYLVKTDQNGLVTRDVSVVSLDAPGDTVFPDSSYEVMATVENLLLGFPSFDVIAAIDGYSDTVHVQGLPPDSLVQITYENWQVPPTDSATYTMSVCAHAFNDIDTANDCKQKTIFAYNPTEIEERPDRPSAVDFRLWQNEPNPFSRSTVIRYCLPVSWHINLSVYDITGRLAEALVEDHQGPGVYQIPWAAVGQPSGVYFCRLQTNGATAAYKMILVR